MTMKEEEFRVDSISGSAVRGFLHRAKSADADKLVLTHGAGANCRSTLLTTLAEAFCMAGVTVLRCDLPFRQARPHGPPPRGSALRDQEGLRAAVEALRAVASGRIFLGGHSYGGRQASMLAAQEPQIAQSLLLLSYPLHPPEKPEQLRTDHFPSLRIPAFFVSGDKDGFGTPGELEAALKLIPARVKLMLLSGVGHELISKKNVEEAQGNLVRAFLAFAAG